jgi:2-oxoglutarate ferredoxin oxidoreductase subunit gamma
MKKILIAGFGGQGILFAGKFVACSGMLEGLEVTWMPAYGAESRGGSSHCHIIISERPIASPVIVAPEVLICLNLPSLNRFESKLEQNGTLFIDNSMVNRDSTRSDAKVYNIPATRIAYDNDLDGLANMIMLGVAIRECNICNRDLIQKTMSRVVPERKQNMLEMNLKAINIGLEYKPE